MLKKILSIAVILLLNSYSVIGQNCPEYSSIASGSGLACGGQNYVLTLLNTACNGEIYFNIVGNYGTSGNQITWEVISSQSETVVASGGPGADGDTINIVVGPLDPSIDGFVYDLIVYDSFGDGFTGGGFIQTVQDGIVLANINGSFSQSHLLFNANLLISSATLTINTPSGNVIETVSNCDDFITQVPLTNTNYCKPINVNLPWTVRCDVSGGIIASGTHNVTIYPQVPTSADDLVKINWNSTTCKWDVDAQNDCESLDIGNIFTIDPNPNGPEMESCTGGNQNFTIEYLGFVGGPNCCSTAGPQVPITYTENYNSDNAVAQNSPFGGQGNSALLFFQSNNLGGNATSLDLCFDMTNFCFNPPSTTIDNTFYVFVFIDGNQVYASGSLFGSSHSFCIDLADIPNGYTQTSEISIYTIPNSFYFGDPTVYTTFDPIADCAILGDGVWTADFVANLDVVFEQTTGSPVNCSFDQLENQICCASYNLPNVITPNQDGNNDILQFNLKNIDRVYIEIFNRWGNKVGLIESIDPNNGWSGIDINTGKQVTDGVYFYTYEFIDYNGKVITGQEVLTVGN